MERKPLTITPPSDPHYSLSPSRAQNSRTPVSFGISSIEDSRRGGDSPPSLPSRKPAKEKKCCGVFFKWLSKCCKRQEPDILETMRSLLKAKQYAEILHQLSSKPIHGGQPNINVKNVDGETILFLLCWHEKKDRNILHLNGIPFRPTFHLFQLIIAHGANLEVQNRHGLGILSHVSPETLYLIASQTSVESIAASPHLTLARAVEKAGIFSETSWMGPGNSAAATWVQEKAPIRKKYLEKAVEKISEVERASSIDFPRPMGIFQVAIQYSYFDEWRNFLSRLLTTGNFNNLINDQNKVLLNKVYDLSQPDNEHLKAQLEGYQRTAELLVKGNAKIPKNLGEEAYNYGKSTEDFFIEIGWDPRKPDASKKVMV